MVTYLAVFAMAFVAGVFVGVCIMAAFAAAGRADEWMSEYDGEWEGR